MSKSFARDKGQRAERAAVALLQPIVDKVYALAEVPEADWPKLIRNLQQTQSGGFDIAGLEWLARHQDDDGHQRGMDADQVATAARVEFFDSGVHIEAFPGTLPRILSSKSARCCVVSSALSKAP